MHSDAYPLVDLVNDRDGDTHGPKPPTEALGIPSRKPRIRLLDLTVLVASLASCAFALVSVYHESFAWRLGYQYQLVVIGLMLSIMNLCLGYAIPFALVLIEARFGASTLQNYDAILRKSCVADHAGWLWRFVLLAATVLPLGLSAAYKLFAGGENVAVITYNKTINYEMYPPPGYQWTGMNTGISLMVNTSSPFVQGTIALGDGHPGIEPTFGIPKRAYGIKTLLLSDGSVAALDIPSPDTILEVQSRLGPSEYWHIEASVLATVTRSNDTIEQHREWAGNSDWWDKYSASYDITVGQFYDDYQLWFLYDHLGSDQSWLFFAMINATHASLSNNMSDFAAAAHMFTTRREPCHAKWAITSSSIELVDGACGSPGTETQLPQNYQNILTLADVNLDIYISLLMEFLGPFKDDRKGSEWFVPTMAASTAGMLYARLAALRGPMWYSFDGSGKYHGMKYRAKDGVQKLTSTRKGLQRSTGLAIVLVVQPVLLVAAMLVVQALYKVPVDRGFGMVSILAGVDPASLHCLQGASLSAELSRRVRLGIAVCRDVGHEGLEGPAISYTVDSRHRRVRDRIKPGVLYE